MTLWPPSVSEYPSPSQRDDNDLDSEGALDPIVETGDEVLSQGGASPRRSLLNTQVRHAGCACR